MVNNTVNTGKPAGSADKTKITFASVVQEREKLKATSNGKKVMSFDEFISIRVYEGGNPNKRRSREERA